MFNLMLFFPPVVCGKMYHDVFRLLYDALFCIIAEVSYDIMDVTASCNEVNIPINDIVVLFSTVKRVIA